MAWHPLQPVDEAFFDTASFVYRYPVDLDVPPARVWESLTSDRALADWGLGLKRLEWTSARPFGVGTTREVTLPGGLITIRERFFRWEDGHRKSFHGTEIDRPLLASFAEDYLVEARGDGSRFTWTIAFEPTARTRLPLRLAGPGNALLYRAVPLRARAYFARHP